MEYHRIDQEAIADEVIARKLAEQLSQLTGARTDIAARNFCNEVRAADGKEPDQRLIDENVKAEYLISQVEARVALLQTKIAATIDVAAMEQELLDQSLSAIERDHAARSALADVSDQLGETQLAETARMEMVLYEGGHDAVLAQMDTPIDLPAPDVSPEMPPPLELPVEEAPPDVIVELPPEDAPPPIEPGMEPELTDPIVDPPVIEEPPVVEEPPVEPPIDVTPAPVEPPVDVTPPDPAPIEEPPAEAPPQ